MATEKEYKIKTPDGKIIEGIFRGATSNPCIIIVHGLAGNMNEALHYNAARYFEKLGFSSFRFNLYSWENNARKLHECTFKTHGEDIDTVLAFLKSKKIRKMFILGHSYGFPSILHAQNQNFKAVVSWDGSFLPHPYFSKLEKISEPIRGRIFDEGYWTIMGEGMFGEASTVNSITLLKGLHKPVKFITVSSKNTGNLVGSKKMLIASNYPKELAIIKGASHNFTEEGKQEELYRETVKWFKKF